MPVDATAVIGLLVGFLVVGVIGTYVGDQMIQATNLTGVSSGTAVEITQSRTWTAGADVYTIGVRTVGAGAGGGAGNATNGGGAGTAGAQNTYTVSVSPGETGAITIGVGGANGVYPSTLATNGTLTQIVIAGYSYNSTGGIRGLINGSATADGQNGVDGYGSTGNSTPAGIGAGAGAAGARGTNGVGYGASGAGGASNTTGGSGGDGANGTIIITSYITGGAYSPLGASQNSVVETFQLGVNLCKILIIVSVASIVFVLLQKTGLIPRFGA